jgi:thymidine phosphorylase
MLKVKFVALDTYPENTAFLSRCCGVYRPEEFQALRKIGLAVNGPLARTGGPA